ncbi:hypothetical protein [Citrobacter freundii complex sp. 2024EL-00748]|uniref:hypothetical protein n=1 Tax=Citrobacter freundii complex sp. 2024EL-00748 TaxID=3382813 RepID=UPI003BD9467B
MMKRNILAVVIPALLVAGAANAAEVYNKDGNKLDKTSLLNALKTGLRSCFFISASGFLRLKKTPQLFVSNGWHFVNLPLT